MLLFCETYDSDDFSFIFERVSLLFQIIHVRVMIYVWFNAYVIMMQIIIYFAELHYIYIKQ